ncbi:MAG: hypothetical protein EOP20_09845 [Hyphomicrobiales bacterium]|nr:MAG: hypothetical protein EOP20_09845 [Hyphomicrobiales bacterium]
MALEAYRTSGEVMEQIVTDPYPDALDRMEAQEESRTLQEVIAEAELTNLEWAVVTAARLGFDNLEIAPELATSLPPAQSAGSFIR